MKFKKEDEDKLKRYADGFALPEEMSEVGNMFADGENNTGLRRMLEEDWYSIVRNDAGTDRDLKPLLHSIHHQIRLHEAVEEKRIFRRLSNIYFRVAAVLLLPLLLAGGYLLFRGRDHVAGRAVTTSIYAPHGSRVSFTLPDGSTGMLNSGSTLSYSLPFTDQREVTLDGEAWLEVSHDAEHPFDLSTGNLHLAVLGTSFNVNAYPEENYVEVVLESGKISLSSGAFEGEILMKPSERFVLEGGKMSREFTDPSKYSSWTEGKLVFRSDSMSEVARRIERWYNVKVELMDSELENYSFRATFEDDPLEEVLRCLSMTSPIRYEITPGTLGPDSTFTKSVVNIFLK